MDLTGRDIVTTKGMTREEIDYVLDVTSEFEDVAAGKADKRILESKMLATLFFEPSTRTRFSFESAMKRLGGDVIGFANPDVTSVWKGESLSDTVKIFGKYSDVIVIRHPERGSAEVAAESTDIPVINGGDDAHQHPTQALLDLYTIRRLKGTIDGLSVVLMADHRHSRVINSLSYAFSNYDVKIYFVAPEPLQLSEEVERDLIKMGTSYKKLADIGDVISETDVLYTHRIQKERFGDRDEAEKMKGKYAVTLSLLEEAQEDMIVLHPGPRLDECPTSIDDTPFAKYFDQAFYGVPLRMALLSLVLGRY